MGRGHRRTHYARKRTEYKARKRAAADRQTDGSLIYRSAISGKEYTFANKGEIHFAKMLDAYGVAWEYEPTSFPIAWDSSGNAVEYFTPDFRLPELDLYIEVTTMRQSLVTRKHRKIKLFKKYYPNYKIQAYERGDVEDLFFRKNPDALRDIRNESAVSVGSQ